MIKRRIILMGSTSFFIAYFQTHVLMPLQALFCLVAFLMVKNIDNNVLCVNLGKETWQKLILRVPRMFTQFLKSRIPPPYTEELCTKNPIKKHE